MSTTETDGPRPATTARRTADCDHDGRKAPLVEVSSDGATVLCLCPSQDRIEITFDDGDAILTQSRWPDEDDVILIRRENIPDFIDRLTDALGVPSCGRP
jgi:hypothetical protein